MVPLPRANGITPLVFPLGSEAHRFGHHHVHTDEVVSTRGFGCPHFSTSTCGHGERRLFLELTFSSPQAFDDSLVSPPPITLTVGFLSLKRLRWHSGSDQAVDTFYPTSENVLLSILRWGAFGPPAHSSGPCQCCTARTSWENGVLPPPCPIWAPQKTCGPISISVCVCKSLTPLTVAPNASVGRTPRLRI